MKLAALLTTFCLAATLYAQTNPTQGNASLLVLSKHDHTLAIVDPATFKVIARVPVGNDPHEVIASADGSTAYVSNYGGGAYNTLAAVDLVHQSALAPIDLGPLRGPHGLTFVGGKTWFTAEAAKAIGRYDPATQKVDWILGTGQNRTHMIYVFPDEQHILTTNVSSGTVSLIQKEPVRMPGPPPGMKPPTSGSNSGPPPPPPGDRTPRMDWNETVIPVGHGAEGFDVSPDHRQAWVANAQDGTISVVDLDTKQVVATIAANVPGANRLKFTPDGKRVLVSSLGGPDLVIFDPATRREVQRLPIGHGAAGIEIEPDGARAFVACTPDNYVTVIDLHSLAVVGKIDAGPEPDGLAWAVRRSTP
jgi:YVTN family beta-propeller protein